MLRIVVLGDEHFNEETEEFLTSGDVVLELEHSLAALSKWESIYEKPFLGPDEKTQEEVLGYIKAMIVTPDYPPEIFQRFSRENFDEIDKYINAKSTATWFHDTEKAVRSREIITSELIYYWMTMFSVPLECEHWHLNRLFTLLKIANVKNAQPKKQSKAEIAARNRQLNEQRRAQFKTTG